MNLLGYVKSNQQTFDESPFSAVDALLVSWIAYFDFDLVKELLPRETFYDIVRIQTSSKSKLNFRE